MDMEIKMESIDHRSCNGCCNKDWDRDNNENLESLLKVIQEHEKNIEDLKKVTQRDQNVIANLKSAINDLEERLTAHVNRHPDIGTVNDVFQIEDAESGTLSLYTPYLALQSSIVQY